MTNKLSDFFRFNLWANRTLLDTCATLNDAQLDLTIRGVYGTVRETLVHLVRAEEGYARAVVQNDTPQTPPLKDFTTFPGFDELQRRIEWSGNALLKVAEQDDLGRKLYLDDGTYNADVIIVLMQAVAHGVEHRVEITAMLNQHEIAVLELDVWTYNDVLHGLFGK
jgi:uncharacterized damage-inducible protein DinB